MPRKLDPEKAKPFQPLAADLVRSVIDEEPASAATALAEPPQTPPEERIESTFEPSRGRRERVVPMRRREKDSEPQPETHAYAGGGERLNRPLKVQLAPTERNEMQRIVNLLSQELGTPVSASHVARALLAIFRNAEESIIERARQTGPLKRPPNDDLTAIAAFELRLAKLLSGALRTAAPLRE